MNIVIKTEEGKTFKVGEYFPETNSFHTKRTVKQVYKQLDAWGLNYNTVVTLARLSATIFIENTRNVYQLTALRALKIGIKKHIPPHGRQLMIPRTKFMVTSRKKSKK